MTSLGIVIPLGILIFASVVLLVFWSVAAYRILRELRALPTARAGIAMARTSPPPGSVCVVVPAHNEQGSIEALVRTLAAQDHPRAHFVLCLDRCTDATERLARDAIGDDDRFTIIVNDHCPEDWAGKVHAVWRGVSEAAAAKDADHLLFTDADCTFAPECLSATIALLEHRDLDMLSLFSTQETRTWFEKFVQPTTTIELARQYPLVRANERDPDNRRAFANGQFMLFRAAAYRAIGGHEHDVIRGALLEDIAFARLLKYFRRPAGLLLADGVVTCGMYDTWAQYRRGWKRIYTESANQKAGRLRTSAARMVAIFVVLPVAAVLCLLLGLTIVPGEDVPLRAMSIGVPMLGLIAWGFAQTVFHIAGRSPVWAVPLSPVGAWLTAGILREAARDLDEGRATEWGGRSYERPKR
ncbi:MAG: glycosyl hydrolase [Phycisphaeraceae bacterium]|nr:MAG: glycosyl hydrolase [Phycisphaeraceae bacterium]